MPCLFFDKTLIAAIPLTFRLLNKYILQIWTPIFVIHHAHSSPHPAQPLKYLTNQHYP